MMETPRRLADWEPAAHVIGPHRRPTSTPRHGTGRDGVPVPPLVLHAVTVRS